jgi:hypothetical protein
MTALDEAYPEIIWSAGLLKAAQLGHMLEPGYYKRDDPTRINAIERVTRCMNCGQEVCMTLQRGTGLLIFGRVYGNAVTFDCRFAGMPAESGENP